MLNVIFSDTSKGAAKAVFERLKRTPGRKIVLVPDSYTLGVEKTVMEETGLKATFDIEVTGFSRLASKETGAEVLSKEGGVLIMKRAINACAGELKHYAKVVGVQGFAGEMFAVVTSMRLNGVTPEMLQAAESDLDDCATVRKNLQPSPEGRKRIRPGVRFAVRDPNKDPDGAFFDGQRDGGAVERFRLAERRAVPRRFDPQIVKLRARPRSRRR